MRMGGKNAGRIRGKMAEILQRYFAGDISLIPEIKANLASNDPMAEMARDSMQNDSVRGIPVEREPIDDSRVPPDGGAAPDMADASGVGEKDSAPDMAGKSGPSVGAKRAFTGDPMDRELEREERRIAIAERKKALKKQNIELVDSALKTYDTILNNHKFDEELREAAKQMAIKLVKGMDNGDEDASGM